MISNQKYRGKTCLNCQHPLDVSDKFCCNCGQLNSNKRLSLGDFVNEFLANFYAYDSRIRRTIVSLSTKPGKAAKEFVDGKRQTYVNPFRFYLSISVIYFLFIGLQNKYESIQNPDEALQLQGNDKVFVVNEKAPTAEKDSVKKPEKFYTEKEIQKENSYKTFKLKLETFATFYEQNPKIGIEKALDSLQYEKTNTNKFIYKKVVHLTNIMESEGAEKSFLNYLLANLPIAIFFSLPLITLAFSLLYISKKMNYAEHLVFVFSTTSFVFFILLLSEIQYPIFNLEMDTYIFIGLIFYFYKSLRNFYQQSRWKTILKFVILTLIIQILLVIAILIGLSLVFLTY